MFGALALLDDCCQPSIKLLGGFRRLVGVFRSLLLVHADAASAATQRSLDYVVSHSIDWLVNMLDVAHVFRRRQDLCSVYVVGHPFIHNFLKGHKCDDIEHCLQIETELAVELGFVNL